MKNTKSVHPHKLAAAAVILACMLGAGLTGCSTTTKRAAPQRVTASEAATPENAPTATPAPTAAATPAPTEAPIVPTSVTLEQEGGILNKGMTWTLHATVLPEDAADKTLHWTSSDEGVATIDDNGIITALAPGQTTITAASTAGEASTTYNLVVQEVVKCSYCGLTGHTADNCTAARQAAEQPAAAVPAQDYAVTAKGDRIYPEGSPDIPEGGVVQRPDGSFYVKGPRNVIFGYEEGDPDPNMPAWTGLCVFCGDDDHDVYHCPILDAQENPDAFLIEDWEK